MVIIATPESNIISDTSSFESAEFSIRTDAAMFDVFRSRIYSDVILAPIRELSTNCIDSCIQADLPIQWDAHIPTLTEPYFAVRDYGGGLPLDFLAGDFCVIGASTKRNDNLTTGAFGMGRLSPLAYTTSCTVESFIDGMHHSYMLTIQEGIPVLLHLSSVQSTEPSGARFSFPVKTTDISTFHSKAANLYKYFEHQPTLINVDLPEVKVHLNHDNFMITEDSLGLVMGNIYYPIRNGISSNYLNLVLKVPIGKVSLTPGRESLNYDEVTCNYLRDYIAEAEEELIAISNTEIASQPTDYQRLHKLHELSGKTPWRIRDKLVLPSAVTACTFQYGYSCPIQSSLFTVSYKHPSYKNTFSPSIRPISDSFFFAATYLLADTRTFLPAVSECGSKVVIFRPIDFTPDAIQAVEDFLEAFGITNYERSSSYSHLKSESKPRSVDVMVRHIRNGYLGSPQTYRTSDATFYYVPLNGNSLQDDISISTLSKMFDLLLPNRYLYGIAKTHLSKISKLPTSVNFFDYLRDTYDESNPIDIVYSKSEDMAGYSSMYGSYRERIHKHHDTPPLIKAAFDSFAKIYSNPFRDLSDTAIQQLQSRFNCTFTRIVPPSTWEQLTAAYPLMDDLGNLSPSSLSHYFKLESHYAQISPSEGQLTVDHPSDRSTDAAA